MPNPVKKASLVLWSVELHAFALRSEFRSHSVDCRHDSSPKYLRPPSRGWALRIQIPIFNRNKREIAELQAKKKDLISGEQALRNAIATSRNLATQNLLEARRLLIDLTDEASDLNSIYGDEKLIAAMTINEERKLKVAQLNFERAVLRARYDYQLAIQTYDHLAQSAEPDRPDTKIETPIVDRATE